MCIRDRYNTMKKMIVLTSLWSFLFIFSFSMFGCSEDDDEFGDVYKRQVGYGIQKKESLTGAIGNLKVDDIVKTKAPSLAQAIQGKVDVYKRQVIKLPLQKTIRT